MKLKRQRTKAFSQGADIAKDLRGGWCAGITAMVSHRLGSWSIESGMSVDDWIDWAFNQLGSVLDGINTADSHVTASTLQLHLSRIRDKHDVCGELHQDEFNGRSCKVLLSCCGWMPLLGYASYIWNQQWVVNHIGYIVRGGNRLIVFDPNYGAGVFAIEDNQPLTLDNLTTAVRELAWANSAAYYYLSSTVATAVVDESAFKDRVSVKLTKDVDDLVAQSKKWLVHK